MFFICVSVCLCVCVSVCLFVPVDLYACVSGFGTGGTLQGVARGLKSADSSIRIVAAEPDNAPVLGSGVPQPRDAYGNVSASHPHFRPHLMQGWSPDFVSSLTEQAMADGLIDQIEPVDGNEALEMARALAACTTPCC